MEFKEDIKFIKEHIKEIESFSDVAIEALYSEFSNACYCSGWVPFCEKRIPSFRKFIFDGSNATYR